MHRWATAPFSDVRSLEHKTLMRGDALLAQISVKK